MNVIKVNTLEEQKKFLELPRALYKTDYHQSDEIVEQFLRGTHPLSAVAKITHYLLIEGEIALGRMTLTQFPDNDTLYIGFFECQSDQAGANLLFETAKAEAVKLDLGSVTGPVDVSFWIGYRFKTNNFDRVFFGEPQNKEYYPNLFQSAGFLPIERYVSHYQSPIQGDETELAKFKRRNEQARSRGIRLVHPDPVDFDKYLRDIHSLLMELYSDFPVFHPLSYEDFKQIFGGLKYITDSRLIVLAYDGLLPVGFFISFPDYGNSLMVRSKLKRFWNLYKTKRHPKQIILSYSGVKKGYEGLSGALYYNILLRVKELGLPTVSTLMKKGKVTAGFGRELEESTTEYQLYELKVKNDASDQAFHS